MSNAIASLRRGLNSYVQQQVDGWRTGTRGSQVFVTTILVTLIGLAVAVILVFGDVVPMALWVVLLMLGVMLLRFLPLLLVTVVVLAAATWAATRLGFDQPRVVSSLVILALAAALAVAQSSRQRSGLPVALSEAVLAQLRDRLQRQGVVPALPNGWRSQSAVLTAHGPSYAGDFLVADLRDGRWLEMALVDVCGKGVSVGPQALQFAGALGGLIGALPPGELMLAANGFLLRQESDESLATAVHLKVDLVTGDYTITSAGHPPALHWHLRHPWLDRRQRPRAWPSASSPTSSSRPAGPAAPGRGADVLHRRRDRGRRPRHRRRHRVAARDRPCTRSTPGVHRTPASGPQEGAARRRRPRDPAARASAADLAERASEEFRGRPPSARRASRARG